MIRKYEIIETGDGSHTLKLAGTNITFHSCRGAVQESQHVFIKSGFEYFVQQAGSQQPLAIFEVGLGTGLNALLTAMIADQKQREVIYYAIDRHPLPVAIYTKLNYPVLLQEPVLYKFMMQAAWNELLPVTPFFKLQKIHSDLNSYTFHRQYDIIYFDAFAPDDQEEMWTDAIYRKMYDALYPGGVLVTYCSKSMVRRALMQAGFLIEKLPGPPGKREIIRANKSF
ncbi:tRNA (5-methylaminomethyl-2-thiouridine)(34)-methyltransferase MnmC2 [Niabella aquatica]